MVQRLSFDPSLVDHAKAALAKSPGWARVALTCESERLRKEALTILASNFVSRLGNPPIAVDVDQLSFF